MELFKHQKEAVSRALAKQGNLALFHDPGCGKSRTTLEIYAELKKNSPALKLLVVCPKSIIRAAWQEDVAKFTTFKFCAYEDLDVPRLPDVGSVEIVAINYEKLISAKHLPKIKDILRRGDWMLAADEVSRCKNHKSITTKTLLALAPLFKHRVVLSGTPMPNSELEIWAPIRLVDGQALPESFFAFRNQSFYLGRGNQTMPTPTGRIDRATMQQLFRSGWKYKITKQKREELMHRIAPFCHWVKKADALDLPEQIDEIREVTLSDAERKAYREMEKFLVIETQDEVITAPVALTRLVKLRQVTSGFAYNQSGHACRFGSSKLQELMALLDELGQQPVIIWIQFKAEVEEISKALSDSGKTFSTLYSETADREASIRDFQEGRVQYFLAHPKSAGHGLTLVGCSTAIYYSLDFSWESYTQSRDRIHRIAQKNHCLYLHLVCPGTIDADILAVLRKKKSLQEVIYAYFKRSAAEILVEG